MLHQVEGVLRDSSAWWLKTHGDIHQKSGVPDLLVCLNGRFVALEGKQHGQHPTPLQHYTLDQIAKAGGLTGVVRSVTDLEDILRREADHVRV